MSDHNPMPARRTGRHLLVLAKEPVAGRVKTRLSPPLTPDEAAAVAAAALADTLQSVAACGADRKILALDGKPGDWLPPGIQVIAQRGRRLEERLAAAWSDAGGPGLQIGMDTPQVTPALLDDCLAATDSAAATAALGLADDGGWWALGLRTLPTEPGWADALFAGVPMSTSRTGMAQLGRLRSLGHRVARLPDLRDVDRIDDAAAVAVEIPGSRFASTLTNTLLTAEVAPTGAP